MLPAEDGGSFFRTSQMMREPLMLYSYRQFGEEQEPGGVCVQKKRPVNLFALIVVIVYLEQNRCFHVVQFRVLVESTTGILASELLLFSVRRVISDHDTLCLSVNCLENDRREDPLPSQGPQTEQGGGLTRTGRGGSHWDVYLD